MLLYIAVLLSGSVIGFNMFKQQKIAEFMANRPEPEFPSNSDWKFSRSTGFQRIEAIGFIGAKPRCNASQRNQRCHWSNLFESGTDVKNGQQLVPSRFWRRKGKPKEFEARLPAAKAKYKRYQGLYKKGSISKEDTMKQKRTTSLICWHWKFWKHRLNAVKSVQLSDGKVGIRNVYLGQYLQSGTDIVRLEDTSVMRLRFTVSQTDILPSMLVKPYRYLWTLTLKTFEGLISAIEPSKHPKWFDSSSRRHSEQWWQAS